MSSNLADESSLADGPPGQSSMDSWETITLRNFHDRLTPPPPPINHRYMAGHYTDGAPSQSSMDSWETIILHNFHDRLTPPPPPINHRYMADHYTDGPPVNQAWIAGKPLHCTVFMTD